MTTRYYFHLIDTNNVIRDDSGVMAADLMDAHRAAAEIIKEFRSEHTHRYGDWSRWKLVVTDDSAEFALVIPLAPEAP